MSPGQNFWLGSDRGHPSFVSKISPKNPKFFNLLPSSQKNLIRSGQKVPGLKTGWPLVYCGSKVCSGRGPYLAWRPWPLDEIISYFWRVFSTPCKSSSFKAHFFLWFPLSQSRTWVARIEFRLETLPWLPSQHLTFYLFNNELLMSD